MGYEASSYISRGCVLVVPNAYQYGIIEVDEQKIEIPEVLYLFWEQFLEATEYLEAKRSFIEYGFEEGLFVETFEILQALGLIENAD